MKQIFSISAFLLLATAAFAQPKVVEKAIVKVKTEIIFPENFGGGGDRGGGRLGAVGQRGRGRRSGSCCCRCCSNRGGGRHCRSIRRRRQSGGEERRRDCCCCRCRCWEREPVHAQVGRRSTSWGGYGRSRRARQQRRAKMKHRGKA